MATLTPDEIVEAFAGDGMTVGYDDWLGAIEDACWAMRVEVDVRDDYSGRGMYGRECVAYEIGPSDVAAFGAAVALAVIDLASHASGTEAGAMPTSDLIRRLTPTRIDGMGMDVVVY